MSELDRQISSTLLRVLFKQLEIGEYLADSGTPWVAGVRRLVTILVLSWTALIFALAGAVLWLQELAQWPLGPSFLGLSAVLTAAGGAFWVVHLRAKRNSVTAASKAAKSKPGKALASPLGV